MSPGKTHVSEATWRKSVAAWNGFWFTPRDPTVLGLIRICCGTITLYTLVAFGLTLDDFVGSQAWLDDDFMEHQIFDRPFTASSLGGKDNPSVAPANLEQDLYGRDYQNKFGEWPPPPYPRNAKEAAYCEEYRYKFGFDLRTYGLPPPENEQQNETVKAYTELHKAPMPPPYPRSLAEAEAIDEYIAINGIDPRRAYAKGLPTFSVFFHIQDSTTRLAVHCLFLGIVALFTLGIGTRVTSILTWFVFLNYIHRNYVVLFGTDQMTMILLLYLAIGPSGAALSIDSLLARWWKGRAAGGGLAPPEPPPPSVAANVAVRLLQIHLCNIYCMAGLSKLLGHAWWNGNALWPVLANFEFAPMNWHVYNAFLNLLGQRQWVFEIFMTGGIYFTLFFEIGYAFLIWRPSLRWVILSMGIVLHGVIGLFMGLQTFALIMLVMNMAFLRADEVRYMLAGIGINLPEPKP